MDINILQVILAGAQFATIIGVLYGLFWIRNFKKQKRIEHLCQNTKDAITALREAEERVREFSFAKERTLEEQKVPTDNLYHIQLHLLCSFGMLRDYLLLIKWDADLVKTKDMEIIDTWLEILNKILGHNYHNNKSDFFIELNGLEKQDTNKYENMRLVLHNIYMLKIKQ